MDEDKMYGVSEEFKLKLLYDQNCTHFCMVDNGLKVI